MSTENDGIKVDPDQVEITLTAGRRDEHEHGFATQMQVVSIMEQMLSTMNRKQRGYQDSWREQGYMGNAARVLSKASRIRNLLWKDMAWSDIEETIEDTLVDLAMICIFALINRREENKWGTK